MSVKVYIERGYLTFSQDGVIFYDFPAKDYEYYLPFLSGKNWFNPSVHNKILRLLDDE